MKTQANIDGIVIGNRARKSSDITALAASMSEIGLIQPVIIDEQNNLICGFRRLLAAKHLGWHVIDVVISESSADTLHALKMERDENNQRVAFTPSEAVAMAAMIEGQARAEAKVRQVDALARGNQTMHGGNDSAQLAGIVKQAEFTRESRQQIAEAVGMATTTLRRAQDVVKHGSPELVKAMDSGEVSITRAAEIAKHPVDKHIELIATPVRQSQKQAEGETKKTMPARKASEDALNAEGSPFSARVIGFQIMQKLEGFRITDPNTEDELMKIMAQINRILSRMETFK